ncbi:hypothetical protein DQ04_14771030 [Trypanosoma grayi]|uniref:hypothetical protein n=1 Tax=Trypanosoma grayi TaxID=71804 RepID=UPI0004F3FCB4|nr:hypothetical protein DQ04_14771030 [Trypanosoma grayi]KEG06298.1 hypothetical protein DQ04_14771030 [Trypanosoma grayi]
MQDGFAIPTPGGETTLVVVNRFPLTVTFVRGGNVPSGLSTASSNTFPVMAMFSEFTVAPMLPANSSMAPSLHVHPSNVTFTTWPVIVLTSTVSCMEAPLNVTLR